MDKLIITGCGVAVEDLTSRAAEIIFSCDAAVFQTERMQACGMALAKRGILTCDDCYAGAEDFDCLNRAIYEKLSGCAGVVCYAVFGSGLDDTGAAFARSQALAAGIPVDVVPGISLAESACALCGYIGSKRVYTAFDCLGADIVPGDGLCVTCIDDLLLAGRVKCKLLEYYAAEQPVVYCVGGVADEIELFELDRQKKFDHTAALIIEPVPFERLASYNTNDLLNIMSRLRAFDGCPWDREQTHFSLRRYLIEEAYEVADAVEQQDPFALADELGDVLLQVVFHAQIGGEHGEFCYRDTVNAVCRKMIKRHPHIFGGAEVSSSDEVLANWESIKREERGQTDSDVLKSVVRSLPALMRAEKVGDKARHAGFDFEDEYQAFAKLREELDELEAELSGIPDRRSEELGDLLFAAVNVARKCSIQPEMALNAAADKFVRRFCLMESAVNADGKQLRNLTMKQMDEYWDKIKKQQDNI